MKRIFAVSYRSCVLKKTAVVASGLLLAAFCRTGEAEPLSHHTESAEKTWDMEALKRRGILSEQIENIDKINEVPTGKNVVDIELNGDYKGSLEIQVTEQGKICFTPALFNILEVSSPEHPPANTCYNWLDEQPGTSAIWKSDSQTLSIVIPPTLLHKANMGDYGGAGANINYNYYSSINKTEFQSQQYSWASLNAGVNIANWMLRGQQNIQDNNGEISSTFNSIYIEHFFSNVNKIFQAGEISTKNTLFSLGQLRGFQLYPDASLSSDSGSGVAVDGIANTPQARVEVRQYGQLIYSTLVAAGAFHLTDIPVLNTNAELNVTVVETNRESQQFIIPASQLMSASVPESQGLSLSFGKLKTIDDDARIPAILTMDKNWQPVQGLSLRSGSLLSTGYQSVAAALSGRLLSDPNQSFSLQAMLVRDRFQHKQSAQLRFSSSHALSETLSVSLGATKNTPGFASIEEASMRARRKRNENGEYSEDNTELSLGLNWNGGKLGSFSLTHSLTTSYPNNARWRYFMLNWSQRFENGLQLSTSFSQAKNNNRSNKHLNVNFSWPLGEKRFHNYYRSTNKRNVIGSDVTMPVGSISDLQLAVEETTTNKNRSIQASLSNDLRYTNLNLSMQLDNQHQRNYSVNGSGAVVFHSKGVTFSNSTVQDTYGILSLNRHLAGVPVSTPGGTAWTDWRGMAVIPSLSPWSDNAIDVDVDKLPKNVDIQNGHRTLHPARGSVKQVQIAMLSGRRILMTIALASGQPLPKGSTLWVNKNIVAEAVDEGLVFMTNAESKGKFHVKIAQSTNECEINYTLPESSDENSLYDQLNLVCI